MFGIYVHIPYCVRKCRYCDFPSVPVAGRRPGDYLEALRREILNAAEANPPPADTVYIGGGTPSILSEEQLSFLFTVLQDSIDIKSSAEITVEANPGTIDGAKADKLLSLGANRLSLGIQSFNGAFLKTLGRNHSGEEARSSFAALRGAGFKNIGIDLMYGLPGQHIDDWRTDLQQALDLQPEHLSLYALGIEEGTPMHGDIRNGIFRLPLDEIVVEMYNLGRELSGAAGFRQYEISNFALEGFHSRHNSLVWAMHPYIGIGAGAHSFLSAPDPVRRWNVKDPDFYINRLISGEDPSEDRELLSDVLLAAEALMLGLRRSKGVEMSSFRRRFSHDPLQLLSGVYDKAVKRRWIEIDRGTIRLTPEGRLFSNEIFVHLF